MGGLCADGTVVFSGSEEEDGRAEIVIQDTDPAFFNCILSAEPVFTEIEPPFYDWIDVDQFLFANYGKDWMYGQLAFPAASGLLGPIARENFGFALDHVLREVDLALRSTPASYALLKMVFSLAFGGDEFETNLRSCLSDKAFEISGLEESILELRQRLSDQAPSAALGFGQRFAGGMMVTYVTRGGRYGSQILQGQSRSFRVGEGLINFSYNIIMATLGAAIRCVWEKTILVDRLYLADDYQTRIRTVEPPGIVRMIITALVGNSEGVDSIWGEDDTLFEVMNAAGLCYFDDHVELRVFQLLLEGVRDGGTGNLK